MGAGVGGGAFHQVFASEEEAGTLGSADALATADGHQVGAHLYIAAQVSLRGHHGSAVDDHGNSAGVGDFGYLRKRQAGSGDEGRKEVGDGGGTVVDGGLQLPGGGASSCTDGDELGSGGSVGLVVGEAVDGLDDNFVGYAHGMGQLAGRWPGSFRQ